MPLLYSQNGRLGSTDGGVTTPGQFEAEGAIYTGRRPCLVWFRGDLHVIGYYTRPVVRPARTGAWVLSGIRPPRTKLTVVPGSSSGGSSGGCLAAITFLHKAGGQVLAESNFGNVVNVGDLTGQGRAWSSIDNTTAESRVTHVRGYVSMAGLDFRQAWESPYGITAISENVRTLALTTLGPQDYDRYIPPATKYGHAWAGRMVYANSTDQPYRLWLSKSGDPQARSLLTYRDTHDREDITGIWKARNELLVLGLRSSYLLRQFGAGTDDVVLEKLDSDVGCVSHFGISEIHNRIWLPSEDGIWIYDGGFKYLMKELTPLWRADYEASKDAFLNGFAMHDRINKSYIFVTRRDAREEWEDTGIKPGSVEYVGYYGSFDPSLAGDQSHPDWMLDLKDRFDSAGFYDTDGQLSIGSCDGKIRKQSFDDGDDDGDLLEKQAIIRRGHDLHFEPGDSLEYGKELRQLWAYVESEYNAWTIYARGGDEQAWQGMLPDAKFWYWSGTVQASYLESTRTIVGRDHSKRTYLCAFTPETTHYFEPEKVTGRGFTVEIRATAPRRMEYRGIGGIWGPGSTQRAPNEVTNFDFAVAIAVSPDTPAPVDPRAPFVVTGGGTKTVVIEVDVDAYVFGPPAVPIVVSVVATGTGAWSSSGNITVIGTPVQITHDIAASDDWTVTVSAVDANGVPGNPFYTFRVQRP